MTDREQAIELLENMALRVAPCGAVNEETRLAIALLREKPEPMDVSKQVRAIAHEQAWMGNRNNLINAADFLDQQAQSLRIADEVVKVKEQLNETLMEEIDRLKRKLLDGPDFEMPNKIENMTNIEKPEPSELYMRMKRRLVELGCIGEKVHLPEQVAICKELSANLDLCRKREKPRAG
jgi:hypothetical protein